MNTPKSKTSIERAISELGWELHSRHDQEYDADFYRAEQGGFSTPWRETPEEALADVKELARVEKLLDKAEAKLAD